MSGAYTRRKHPAPPERKWRTLARILLTPRSHAATFMPTLGTHLAVTPTTPEVTQCLRSNRDAARTQQLDAYFAVQYSADGAPTISKNTPT